MPDYVPSNDEQFDGWLDNFHSYVTSHLDHFSFHPADTDPLDAACAEWNMSFTSFTAAQLAAKSTRSTKETDRMSAESVVRSLVSRIQTNPATTDADRQALRITIRGAGLAMGPLQSQDDKPLAIVDVSNRLKHVIRIQNQTSTGTKRAKPANARGCEVWMKIGTAPTGPSDMQLVDVATRSPYILDHADEDAGKTAHYALRWVSTKGEKGSWSETESATIAA